MTLAAGIEIGAATGMARARHGSAETAPAASQSSDSESFRVRWQEHMQAVDGQSGGKDGEGPGGGEREVGNNPSEQGQGTRRSSGDPVGSAPGIGAGTAPLPPASAGQQPEGLVGKLLIPALKVGLISVNEPSIPAAILTKTTGDASASAGRTPVKRAKLEASVKAQNASAPLVPGASVLGSEAAVPVSVPIPVPSQTNIAVKFQPTRPVVSETPGKGMSLLSNPGAKEGVGVQSPVQVHAGAPATGPHQGEALVSAAGDDLTGTEGFAEADRPSAEVQSSGQTPGHSSGQSPLESNRAIGKADAVTPVPDVYAVTSGAQEISAPVVTASAAPLNALETRPVRGENSPASRSGSASDAGKERVESKPAHDAVASAHSDMALFRETGRIDGNGLDAATVRGQGGLTMTAERQPGSIPSSSTNQAGLAGHDAFAAIDAGSAAPATTWIHAGAQRAEAGYLDPALGWVGVRAEAAGGSMHAALVPGSTEAAQALSGQLTGLNAYMAEHHGQASPVTLAAPNSGLGGSGVDQGLGMSYGSGGSGQANADQRRTDTGEPGTANFAPEHRGPVSSNAAEAVARVDHRWVGSGGGHISVMA